MGYNAAEKCSVVMTENFKMVVCRNQFGELIGLHYDEQYKQDVHNSMRLYRLKFVTIVDVETGEILTDAIMEFIA